MAIEAGRVLNERYRLIRPVGQGSQASVWVAEHLALTTHVAVKLIDQELAKKDTARERFRREATAAAQLRSAHVVQILDHGIDGDQPFIVMELLDGEDLFERLAHRNRLSLRETSKIVTQVARALSRAHAAGIIHRDLKPENVFLCPNEDDEVVKVLDFGVAKVKDAAKVTMQKTGVGTLIGTPHYMSPEQVKGIGEVDYHADLWALGVIAFQCVTGELPYDSEGVGDLLIKITIGDAPIPSKVYPGVPTNFDVWFAKACARDPDKRFHSAREMAMALAGVVGVVDGVAPRAPTLRPPAAAAAVAIPQAPRPATQQLEADDWEEVDDEPDIPLAPVAAIARPVVPSPAARVPRPLSNPPPAPRAAMQAPQRPAAPSQSEGHDIVDFDETIPATAAMLADAHKAAWEARNPPPSAPSAPAPPPSAPRRDSGIPRPADSAPRAQQSSVVLPDNGARPPWEAPAPADAERAAPAYENNVRSGPNGAEPRSNMLAPVVMPPPRDSAPAAVPRAPPARTATPQGTPPPSGVPVVTQLEISHHPVSSFVEPLEFDGTTKRRRMVRFMLASLVLAAIGITWTVVRSQIDFSGPSTTPTATSVAAPPPAPTPAPTPTQAPVVTATRSASAVDPGKVTHPTKPTTATPVHKGPPVRQPRAPKPSDGTIVIPEPDEEAVPPAP